MRCPRCNQKVAFDGSPCACVELQLAEAAEAYAPQLPLRMRLVRGAKTIADALVLLACGFAISLVLVGISDFCSLLLDLLMEEYQEFLE